MHNEQWLADELKALRAQHRFRQTQTVDQTADQVRQDGRALLNLASNDYLDLASHPAVQRGASRWLEQAGVGARASRVVTGTLACHEELEDRLAQHKGYPAALLFGAGYLASLGAVGALCDRQTTVLADRLIHASLIDAVRLSGARLQRFRHNNVDHLRTLLLKQGKAGRTLIVCESVYSMDGDLAPLAEIAELAVRHKALLLVDEAHATGVFGTKGAGRVEAEGLQQQVNLAMGTLSKALGGYGGFHCCSAAMRDWLVNRARAFVYTTAPPPPVVGAALAALTVLDEEPERGATLLARADRFRRRLQQGGLDTLHSNSQIVPVVIGDNKAALRVATALRKEGIYTVAIRPPTVPVGTARLRLSLTLAHDEAELDRAADVLIEVCRREGVDQ